MGFPLFKIERWRVAMRNLLVVFMLLMYSALANAACPSTLTGRYNGSFIYNFYSSNAIVNTFAGDITVVTNGTARTWTSSERGKQFSNGATYTINNSGTFIYNTTTCVGTSTAINGITYFFVISNNGNTITLTYSTPGNTFVTTSFVLTRI